MADDVVIRIQERGSRQTARSVGTVSTGLERLGRRGKVAAGGMRLFSRASVSAAGGMRLAAGAAVTGGAAIGGALVIGIKRSVDAWEEKRQIVAQTGAVLKSTGGQANVTAKQVDTLATALSRKSGVDDEAVRDAENLLLTFRDVRNEAGKGNDVFTRATKVTSDLSAAMHMDLRSAALQVGKALNDPARGFARLQRIGVSFSKTQQQQIKDFTAVGDRAGAQRVILAELDKEFGGSAAKQVTSLKRLKVSWGNIEEAVGEGVSPAVDSVASSLDHLFVKAEPDLQRLNRRLTDVFKRKDLDLGQKLTLGAQDAQKVLRPYEHEITAGIRRMHLGDAVGNAIEAGAPAIGRGVGRAAPIAARSFWHAFQSSGPAGQAAIITILGAKFGGFRALGGAIGGLLSRGIGGKVAGKGGAVPVWVVNGGGGKPGVGVPGTPGGGKPGKGRTGTRVRRAARGAGRIGKALPFIGTAVAVGETVNELTTTPSESGNPEGVRAHGPRAPRGSYGETHFNGGRVRAVKPGAFRPIVIHTSVQLDRKEIAKATHAAATDARVARKGG